jgi:PAS domain S-box-containing protein
MDKATVAVLAADVAGYNVYANPEAERIFGWDADSLYGMHISEIAHTDPEWLTTQFESLKRNGVWSGWLTMNRRDGDTVTVTTNCFSFESGGEQFCVGMMNAGCAWTGSERCLPADEPGYGFTVTEFRLLQLLAEGFDSEQAGILLGTGPVEVKRMTGSLLAKTGAASVTETCVRAIKAGLIR